MASLAWFATFTFAMRALEAARALLYLAAAKVTDNAPDKTRFSAMAKRLATDNGSAIGHRRVVSSMRNISAEFLG